MILQNHYDITVTASTLLYLLKVSSLINKNKFIYIYLYIFFYIHKMT